MKFAALDPNGESIQYDYGDRYFRQPCGDSERLVIGASGGNVELLNGLSALFVGQQFFLLYVLLISQGKHAPGRYQSPLIEKREELQEFLDTFQNLLEGDGRHHLWIGSPETSDLLVYDQHDVVFAYGAINQFESALLNRGFQYEEFWFPAPHAHSYDPANVEIEHDVLRYFDWTYFELQSSDEWN